MSEPGAGFVVGVAGGAAPRPRSLPPRSGCDLLVGHRGAWRGLAPAVRAAGRELTQQCGELSLHLDHLVSLVQLGPQAPVLLTQVDLLPLHRVRRRPARPRGLGRPSRPGPLLTPRRDQRRVQTFATQQGTLAGLVRRVVLRQGPRLVRRGIRPWPGRHLRIRHLVDRTHRSYIPCSPSRVCVTAAHPASSKVATEDRGKVRKSRETPSGW